jgi:hypothetical protein
LLGFIADFIVLKLGIAFLIIAVWFIASPLIRIWLLLPAECAT